MTCAQRGCTFAEDVPFYSLPNWADKPCPKCGKGNMFTPQDMIEWEFLKNAAEEHARLNLPLSGKTVMLENLKPVVKQ